MDEKKEVIETTYFDITRIDGKECEKTKGYVRVLILDDVESVMNLQVRVLEELDPLFLGKNSSEEFAYRIKNGKIMGAFNQNDELIGTYGIYIQNSSKNFYDMVGYPESEKCANNGMMMIDSKYRRNGIYPAMVMPVLKYFLKVEKRDQYFSTIYPKNLRSIALAFHYNVTLDGFFENCYGEGYHRYVVHNNERRKKKDRIVTDTVEVELEDFESQKKFFKDGLVGYELKKKEDKYFLLFGKVTY